MISWIVWHIPFLRRRREAEIRAWAEYGWAKLELGMTGLPEDRKAQIREIYRQEF